MFIWYNGQGIASDREGSWSFDNEFAWNVEIFVVDNSSSSHTDNRKNDFLVLGERTTDGINDSTIVARKKLVLTFAKQRQNFT